MATPSTIVAGDSVAINWSVQNADKITIDNGIGVVFGTEMIITPLATTTYKLIAENEVGVDSASVIVTVVPDTNILIVSVNPSAVINPQPKKLLGISFDARSGMQYNNSAISAGYHDIITGNILTAIQPLWSRLPLTGIRYPGNAVSYNWNWKLTVGPVATRMPQTLDPTSTPKTLAFGFDEFMKMVESRGLTGNDIQIMVNIYPIANEVSAAQNAADWVEYCNAPNDGSNPGGGVDWAATRAANGHAAPYDVRTWNIGNEPWSPSEFNFDPTPYIALALPIIDAMKAIDPGIQITLPAVGDANSAWNSGILSSSGLSGKFWGLSPHFFYDENSSTGNPGIAQDEVLLKSLINASNLKGFKIVVGDHAHDAPLENPDKGFQWEGALATANFIAMVSQSGNIERANFWIYGAWTAAWHPIRRNSDGSFTFMAVAALYEELYPVMLDKSVSSSITTVNSSLLSSVRSTAFVSSDGAKLSIMVVNIDLEKNQKLAIPTIVGLTHSKATLITGNLSDDNFTKSNPAQLMGGSYMLPKSSVLILEYIKN